MWQQIHKYFSLFHDSEAIKSNPGVLSSFKVYSYHKHQTDFPFVLNESKINMNKAIVCTKASLQVQVELDLTTNSFRIFHLTLTNLFLKNAEEFLKAIYKETLKSTNIDLYHVTCVILTFVAQ